MRFGLSGETLETLNGFFRARENIQRVMLYGSRAMGNYRAGSDIDITLITGGGFSTSDLLDLEGELADSSLPYFVDVSIFDKLTNKNFIDHINRVGKILYEKSPFLEQAV
jgi:predicted nucleotidyltransferase